MDFFLNNRSMVLEYYPVTLSVFFIISVYFLFFKKKNAIKEVTAEEESIEIEDFIDESSNKELQPFLEEREHVPFPGATIKLDGGADQFYKIVNDRRSVRMFSKKPVDFQLIETCIKAAGTGPSGAHTEPWTFCVISTNEIKSEVRRIIEDEELRNYSQRMSKQWTTDLKPLKTNYVKEYLTDAPYLILVFKQIYGFSPDGRKKQHYYNEISVSISTGILLSAIQCAGLSSLVTTPLNCGPALRNLLNRPINEKLLVLLPVGYAADNCKIPDLQRKQIDDILVKY